MTNPSASRTPFQALSHRIFRRTATRIALAGGIAGIWQVAALADTPTLVRFVARDDTSAESVAGVLLQENAKELRILDLNSLQERTFDQRSLSSVKNPASEQDVASLIGVAPISGWFIARALPPRPESGRVASVDGGVAYVNLGRDAGIKADERLNVFRGEQEIIDPETGETLGTTQRRIAQVEVLEVQDRLSKVRLLGEFEVELRVGDEVRPVSTENPVAVLPFGLSSGVLVQGGVQLAEQVTTYLLKNDVTVVERSQLDQVLEELQLGQTAAFDPETAQSVGELLQAYAVVVGTIQTNGREANVNVRLIEVETGRILYGTSLKVRGLNLSRVTSSATGTVPAPPATIPTTSGLATELLSSTDWIWIEPINLGAVNSDDPDADPYIAPDGRQLLFASTRPGGHGGWDLWMSERGGRPQWGRPVNLGSGINSRWNEGAPCLSADGLTLLFHSNDRPGGMGSYDIWMSTRPTSDTAWEEPVNLGPPINDAGSDEAPSLSPDGLTMYFSSERAGGYGHMDLWVSQRSGPDAEWCEPVNLGAAVNTPEVQSDPEISADGLTLLFAGYVNGMEGPHILWMASRSALDQPFGHRQSWGEPLAGRSTSSGPSITGDGRQLFFHSNYEGSRSWDLWWALRAPR